MNTFWSDYKPGKSTHLSGKRAARVASGKSVIAKPTPNSVRNVEPATQLTKEFLPRIKLKENDENKLGERHAADFAKRSGAIIDFRAGD